MESLEAIPLVVRLVAVGAAWGLTNPLLRRESKPMAKATHRNKLAQISADLWFMVTHWRFTAAYLLNQAGSLLYYFLLGSVPVSTAVPVCNSLAFAFTAFASVYIFGEVVDSPAHVLVGSLLVCAGAAICFNSSAAET